MLIFIERTGETNKNGNRMALYRCCCGEIIVAAETRVKSGATSQCRKCRNKSISMSKQTHGMRNSAEYSIWSGIKARCLNPKAPDYARYGGAGVTVFCGWIDDFMAFYVHIGPRPSPAHSVDRIIGSKGYEPGNVRWATKTQQSRNRKNSVFVTDGVSVLHIVDVAKSMGISKGAAHLRLKRGKLNGYTRY